MQQNILQLIWIPFVVFIVLAIILALHHLYIHSLPKYDHAREESMACFCYLQPSDMRNHEIWVVNFTSIAVTWIIAGYTFESSLRCT
jgi:hypothetical protein